MSGSARLIDTGGNPVELGNLTNFVITTVRALVGREAHAPGTFPDNLIMPYCHSVSAEEVVHWGNSDLNLHELKGQPTLISTKKPL